MSAALALVAETPLNKGSRGLSPNHPLIN